MCVFLKVLMLRLLEHGWKRNHTVAPFLMIFIEKIHEISTKHDIEDEQKRCKEVQFAQVQAFFSKVVFGSLIQEEKLNEVETWRSILLLGPCLLTC